MENNDDRVVALQTLAWLHARLKTIPFYIEEMQQVERSLSLVGEIAKGIDAKLKAEEDAKKEAEGGENKEG